MTDTSKAVRSWTCPSISLVAKTALSGITVDQLPDPGAGVLCIGGQPVEAVSRGARARETRFIGDTSFKMGVSLLFCRSRKIMRVDAAALAGLRFQSAQNPTVTTTTLLFTPSFSQGQEARQSTVTLYLLTEENTTAPG